jgi:hypothetical protein
MSRNVTHAHRLGQQLAKLNLRRRDRDIATNEYVLSRSANFVDGDLAVKCEFRRLPHPQGEPKAVGGDSEQVESELLLLSWIVPI